jgi:Flp pilus assembly protein CpaB
LFLALAGLSALGSTSSPATAGATLAAAATPGVRVPEPGDVAMTVALDDGGAWHGFLRAGDRVDLLATRQPEVPGGAARVTKVKDVLILAVAPLPPPKAGGIGSSWMVESPEGTRLTVSVDAEDVAQVAALQGSLKFAAVNK